MNSERLELIFVYNADSGVFNLLSDVAHKLFSPQTYACNLCAITHSTFGMKDEWRRYLDGLDVLLKFLHADEFKAAYPSQKTELPAIFKRENAHLSLIADARAINDCRSIDELKRLIDA